MRLSFQVDLLKSLKIKIKTLEFFNKDCPKKFLKEFSKDFYWGFLKDFYRGILQEFLLRISLRIFVREILNKSFDMGSILNGTLSRCKKKRLNFE